MAYTCPSLATRAASIATEPVPLPTSHRVESRHKARLAKAIARTSRFVMVWLPPLRGTNASSDKPNSWFIYLPELPFPRVAEHTAVKVTHQDIDTRSLLNIGKRSLTGALANHVKDMLKSMSHHQFLKMTRCVRLVYQLYYLLRRSTASCHLR